MKVAEIKEVAKRGAMLGVVEFLLLRLAHLQDQIDDMERKTIRPLKSRLSTLEQASVDRLDLGQAIAKLNRFASSVESRLAALENYEVK